MGWAKERLIELQARGYGEVPDKYVCAACFGNQGIKDFIERNAIEYFCSYCERKTSQGGNPISASLEDVVGLIVRSLNRLYDDPNNCLPWDSEDHCYFGTTYYIDDVLYDMGLSLTVKDQEMADQLSQDLTQHIDCDTWTPREISILSKSEAYELGWERFVKQVKHYSRFIFSLIHYKPDPYESRDVPLPSQMLSKILHMIHDTSMVRIVKKGAIFYRTRICFEGESIKDTAHDLGAPTNENAKFSNRMSPEGIPMFYGAFEEETAEEEIRAIKYRSGQLKKALSIKIAQFVLLRDISVVDFTRRHDYCLFDEEIDERELNMKAFLNHFVRELSKPIEKDGREHIDYVPTQIVTEYLKYKCVDRKDRRIKGIVYPSARRDGTSCALFIRNNHCVNIGDDTTKAYLQLTKVETKDWK
ncbi:MAG: HEPN-associated N-terminal domain-containing protein [Candidatus Omnitrophota bacterium]|jgi:hypothetical protein